LKRAFNNSTELHTELKQKAQELAETPLVRKNCSENNCFLLSISEDDFESELGIPRHLGLAIQTIFNGLADFEYKTFPLLLTKSIEPGAGLSLVWPKFALWLINGLPNLMGNEEKLANIKATLAQAAAGKTISRTKWEELAKYWPSEPKIIPSSTWNKASAESHILEIAAHSCHLPSFVPKFLQVAPTICYSSFSGDGYPDLAYVSECGFRSQRDKLLELLKETKPT